MLGRVRKQIYIAQLRVRTRSQSESLLITFVCGALAVALSFYFRESSIRPAAPAIFLLIVISVAHVWGRSAGLFVAVVGGLVFAAFLYEPYGSLAVCNPDDRIVLLLFSLSAIAAVCLSRKSDTRPK